mmetsp:Transcript_35030/g.116092  ORF Transcript_35030/g.116092 Transcript_35030/m.116092 type:complete len:309 (-) Transcript_35030:671-1597(-)
MGARHSSAILAALAARASALPMPPPPAVRLRLARALTAMSAAGGERKANLYGLRDEQLEAVLKDWGQPKFRLKQIRDCLYGDTPAADIDAMHTLPKALRARLREHATLGELGVEFEQQSKDGTQKRLWRCHDGSLIESVLMPYDDRRRTACISSQVGCAMGCTFCATGQMGFRRDLSEAEIFEQAARFSSELRARGERLSNVVFMGMGEPFRNYDAVVGAARRIVGELGSRRADSPEIPRDSPRLGASWTSSGSAHATSPSRRSASRLRSGGLRRRGSRSGSQSRCTRPTTSRAPPLCPSTGGTTSTS